MKLYDYVINSGGRAKMLAFEAPQKDWRTSTSVFQNVFDHERKVTVLIKALVDTARSENDQATEQFLQWFADEQVEEEENSDEVLRK
jgi:ferritin